MLRNKKENDNFPDKDNYDIKVNKKAKEDFTPALVIINRWALGSLGLTVLSGKRRETFISNKFYIYWTISSTNFQPNPLCVLVCLSPFST